VADCPDALKADPSIPLPAKAVAGALWDIVHFSDDNPRVWQSRRTIAAGLGVVRKTIDKWIIVLEQHGWLRREQGGTVLALVKDHPQAGSIPPTPVPPPNVGGTPTEREPPSPREGRDPPPRRDPPLSNQSNQDQSSSSPNPQLDSRLPPGRPAGTTPSLGGQVLFELDILRRQLQVEHQTKLTEVGVSLRGWRNRDVAEGIDHALADVDRPTNTARLERVKDVVRHAAGLVAAGKLPSAHFGGMFVGRGFLARLEALELSERARAPRASPAANSGPPDELDGDALTTEESAAWRTGGDGAVRLMRTEATQEAAIAAADKRRRERTQRERGQS